jgi:predicted nucleotidyltransferase
MLKQGTMTASLSSSQAHPVLAAFRTALAEIYGTRLERVVLYGSRARGDATDGSDYDIAVFLRNLSDRMGESDKIANAAANILCETGMLIHAIPFPADSYSERTLLMHEIRREGLDL